jgi:hypothetical protein
MDQRDLTWFAEMNATLHDSLNDDTLARRLRDNVHMMRALASSIVEQAAAVHPSVVEGYEHLVGSEGRRMELFERVA